MAKDIKALLVRRNQLKARVEAEKKNVKLQLVKDGPSPLAKLFDELADLESDIADACEAIVGSTADSELHVEVEIVPDEYATLEEACLGELTEEYKEGCIQTEARSGQYPYYIPAYSLKERIADIKAQSECSEQEAIEEASRGAYAEYRRAWTMGDEWYRVGIKVTVSKADVQLACETMWGFDSDDEAGIQENIPAAKEEAVFAAEQKLAELTLRKKRETYDIFETKHGEVLFEGIPSLEEALDVLRQVGKPIESVRKGDVDPSTIYIGVYMTEKEVLSLGAKALLSQIESAPN